MCRSRLGIAFVGAAAIFLMVPSAAQSWRDQKQELQRKLEGERIALIPTALRNGADVWVPLESFCTATGAVLKDIDGAGQLAV